MFRQLHCLFSTYLSRFSLMASSSSSGSPKVCFNSTCKQALEVSRKGWLCRTGDFADLCDRCASAFKDGKFCDTYHLNASGSRCCESCGKKIHCGCIVSFHMFILLDAGGIECLSCAKTEFILTPNPTWPSAERIRDVSSKHWRHTVGSGPVPWWQAPSLFSSTNGQQELQLISCSLGQSKTDDPCERFVNDSRRVIAPEIIGDRAHATGIQSFFQTNAAPLSSLRETFLAHNQKNEGSVSEIDVQPLCPPPSVGKQCSNNNNNKARGETRPRHQPLPRYWPQFTDQELQQLCGGSNAKITPLFEKVLSASDAGKIGRLVLPKKCAEAYLPPISEPEGYPLVIQDMKGKDWVLQYRFWRNNNSRMYVLEGVTPWIQSMQLQAGDTVTFSRLEPEGKLIMGFRKAPLVSPSNQDNETTNTSISTHEETLNDSKSRNPDGTWSEDKISIRAKRKNGRKVCSNGKHLRLEEDDMRQLSVTLKQVQGLLQPPLNSSSTIVLIDGVELEDFQEAPIIGSPAEFSIDNVRSLSSTEVDATPEHLEHTLPMTTHGNPESSNTIVCIQPPSGSKHESTCTCNVCQVAASTKQVGSSMQNPTQLLYADIIRYTQIANGNSNDDHKAGGGRTFENDPNRERLFNSSFKSQNIDLNIRPEQEEDSSPVSDSMGIMKIVQESTQRYINLQKSSVYGITDGYHTNHDL